MANTLRIKRRVSGSPGAPSSLANAELAFNEVNSTLYYGKGDNGSGTATSIIAIGGDGTFATKAYVDAATPVGVAYLAQDNTWSAGKTNTFNGTVDLEGAFQIDGELVNTSAAELNVLDSVTAGTASAGKALIVDSSKDIASINAISSATITTSGNGTIGGNLTVTGNLTINGTTTTVNSTTVTIDDPIFTLGGDTVPGSDDNKDRGIEFRYYDSAGRTGFFGWDDSEAAFTVLHTATNSSEVFSGTKAPILVGTVNKVTVTQPATGSTLTIADGKTLTASNTLTFTGTDASSVNFGTGGTVVYESTVCSAISNCSFDGGTF